ncbi:MAG: DegQ family serine endoprotease [Nitrospiria bacterium]
MKRGKQNLIRASGWFFFISLGILPGLILFSGINPASAEKLTGPEEKGPFVAISRTATPAVVNISTSRLVKNNTGQNPFFDDPFFRQFFGEEFGHQFQQPKSRKEQSLGSGVIVESDGIIITNNHVIANADEIKVLLSDKREFKGKVIGTDPKTDLAVVKIEAKNLPTIPWGDSGKMEVGEYVLAIGNPFGLNQTVTMGIISALGRANVGISDYEDFIQTDAAINPGNSGGALVNASGELIGINTAIFSRSGGYMGIGFAIPSNMAKVVLESLKKEGKVVRGWLGVTGQEMTPGLAREFGVKEDGGSIISDVLENSPAEKAGLKRGDVIVQYQGKPVDNPTHLRNTVAETPAGTHVRVVVVRNKKEIPVEVTIEEQPTNIDQIGKIEGGQQKEEAENLSGMEVMNLTRDMSRQFGIPFKRDQVVVTSVKSGSSASEAGIQPGDVLLEINRMAVKGATDYNKIMRQIKKGETVLFLIDRQGVTLFLTMTF